MAIHKLADGPITLVVADVELTEGKYGAQYQITGTDSDGVESRVFVSTKAFTQQLGRLKLTPEEALGECLHFEQVKKDGTTFTNINRARPGQPTVASVQAQRAVASAPAGRATGMSVEDAAALYGECVEAAIAKFYGALAAEQIPVSAEAIQSAAATIFIAVKGR